MGICLILTCAVNCQLKLSTRKKIEGLPLVKQKIRDRNDLNKFISIISKIELINKEIREKCRHDDVFYF